MRALARAARVLERASGELSLAHYRVLSAIAAGDARASRIAHRLALGNPTVSAAVDALCQRELVRREEVAGDQRAVGLSVSAEGRTLLHRVESEMVQRLAAIASRSRDPRRLVESLALLGEAIDAERAGQPSP